MAHLSTIVKNNNSNIRNLVFDLVNQYPVNYLHSFKIKIDQQFSLELLTSMILNCFVSPALPRVDHFVSTNKFNEFGTFIFPTEVFHNGLHYVIALEVSNFYLFFLFRSNSYGDVCETNSPIYKMELPTAQHDRFLSFEIFCKVNKLKLQPLTSFSTWNGLSNFSSLFISHFSTQTDPDLLMSFVLLISGYRRNVTNKNPILSAIFCFFSFYNFALLFNKCLYYFSNTVFSFKVLSSYSLTVNSDSVVLDWDYRLLREKKLEELNVTSNRLFEQLDSTLSYKSFFFFEIYCQASQRSLIPTFYQKINTVFFNFGVWNILSIKYSWYSVCGYYIVDSVAYAKQVYDFMQFRMLNFNVQCTFSHLREGRLYFWVLFKSREDWKRFRKENKDLFLIYKNKKFVRDWRDLEGVGRFLKRYTSYRPIDIKKHALAFDDLVVYDYRLASYYIGVYSENHSISCILTNLVFSTTSSFYTIQDTMYEITRLRRDVGPAYSILYKLESEIGLKLYEMIWFFCNPRVPDTCFFQHPRD